MYDVILLSIPSRLKIPSRRRRERTEGARAEGPRHGGPSRSSRCDPVKKDIFCEAEDIDVDLSFKGSVTARVSCVRGIAVGAPDLPSCDVHAEGH